MRPAGPAPTTNTSLRKVSYPVAHPLAALAPVELWVSKLFEVEGTESAVTPGAILMTLGWTGGLELVLVLDDGERFMKGHIDGAIL
jgi:hypothetical protein